MTDEAAPQAAEGADSDETAAALETLRFDWGIYYLVGFDRPFGWWASRHGGTGELITAGSPDGLRTAMAADFGPVKA